MDLNESDFSLTVLTNDEETKDGRSAAAGTRAGTSAASRSETT